MVVIAAAVADPAPSGTPAAWTRPPPSARASSTRTATTNARRVLRLCLRRLGATATLPALPASSRGPSRGLSRRQRRRRSSQYIGSPGPCGRARMIVHPGLIRVKGATIRSGATTAPSPSVRQCHAPSPSARIARQDDAHRVEHQSRATAGRDRDALGNGFRRHAEDKGRRLLDRHMFPVERDDGGAAARVGQALERGAREGRLAGDLGGAGCG